MILAASTASALAATHDVPTVLAGSVSGTPVDSPDRRIDANTPESRFSGVVSIGILEDPATGAARIGSGVLISPNHVLTAAHLFDKNNDGVMEPLASDVRVNFNAGPRSIQRISGYVTHPDFHGFYQSKNDDLAIITLQSTAPAAAMRYAIVDALPDEGSTFVFAGYGRSGYADPPGGSGLVISSWTSKRVGWNQFDIFLGDDEGGSSLELFRADFDGPGDGLGNDVESTVAPGDSGGPSFVEDIHGTLRVAGINTYLSGIDDPNALPTFGTSFGGQAVPAYAAWINTVTGIPEPGAVGAIGLLALILRRYRP